MAPAPAQINWGPHFSVLCFSPLMYDNANLIFDSLLENLPYSHIIENERTTKRLGHSLFHQRLRWTNLGKHTFPCFRFLSLLLSLVIENHPTSCLAWHLNWFIGGVSGNGKLIIWLDDKMLTLPRWGMWSGLQVETTCMVPPIRTKYLEINKCVSSSVSGPFLSKCTFWINFLSDDYRRAQWKITVIT